MQNAPLEGGAVHCGGERRNPSKTDADRQESGGGRKLPNSDNSIAKYSSHLPKRHDRAALQSLEFHVHEFVPDAEGEDLEHRIALLKARDWSAALIGRTQSLMAHNLAYSTHEIAGAFVFALDESVPRLDMAARLCRHLVGAALLAESLDGLERPI